MKDNVIQPLNCTVTSSTGLPYYEPEALLRISLNSSDYRYLEVKAPYHCVAVGSKQDANIVANQRIAAEANRSQWSYARKRAKAVKALLST